LSLLYLFGLVLELVLELLLVVVLVLAWFQGEAYLRLSLALLDVGLRHARGELLVLVVLLGAIDLA
jgi:hypothetical protein